MMRFFGNTTRGSAQRGPSTTGSNQRQQGTHLFCTNHPSSSPGNNGEKTNPASGKSYNTGGYNPPLIFTPPKKATSNSPTDGDSPQETGKQGGGKPLSQTSKQTSFTC